MRRGHNICGESSFFGKKVTTRITPFGTIKVSARLFKHGKSGKTGAIYISNFVVSFSGLIMKRGYNMALLTFDLAKQTKRSMVAIKDRQFTDQRWFVVYKDNLTVIVEAENAPMVRRVYKVNAWLSSNECRAAKMY